MTQPRIVCLIVTWNRSSLLRRCLESLEKQTVRLHQIVVVNNNSSDNTASMLESEFPHVTVLNMAVNSGGAGGFERAIGYANTLVDFDFLWLMDDDAWATPSALDCLIRGYTDIEPQPSFVCSRVIDETNETVNIPTPMLKSQALISWDFQLAHGYLPIESCSFVSALIPAKLARQVGTPLGHYFLWLDDMEYTLRLSEINPGWYVPASIVHHPRPGGLRVPNLIKEPIFGRLHLYKHYYANLLETCYRHSHRFSWWHIRYAIMVIRTSVTLLKKSEYRRLLILMQGVFRGILNVMTLARSANLTLSDRQSN